MVKINFNYAQSPNRIFIVVLKVEKEDGHIKDVKFKIESTSPKKAAKEAEKIVRETWKRVRSVKYLYIEDKFTRAITY
jgi:hypothetical protein